MRYCIARFQKNNLDMTYRVYVTDALKLIAENTSKYAGGSYMKIRFTDIINPKPEETRTADEIITSITDKLRKLQEEDKN
ncbi:MAG: hypothetical protein K2N06_05505 [Oscillospiraceae bacterium]|nr:hypothetical protein [Oscillospiraceae bacterium]